MDISDLEYIYDLLSAEKKKDNEKGWFGAEFSSATRCLLGMERGLRNMPLSSIIYLHKLLKEDAQYKHDTYAVDDKRRCEYLKASKVLQNFEEMQW